MFIFTNQSDTNPRGVVGKWKHCEPALRRRKGGSESCWYFQQLFFLFIFIYFWSDTTLGNLYLRR